MRAAVVRDCLVKRSRRLRYREASGGRVFVGVAARMGRGVRDCGKEVEVVFVEVDFVAGGRSWIDSFRCRLFGSTLVRRG